MSESPVQPSPDDIAVLRHLMVSWLSWQQQGMPLAALQEWFANRAWRCVCWKRDRRRSVYAVYLEQAAAPLLFIKHVHPQQRIQVVKNKLRPSVVYEYRMGKKLEALAGMPVPTSLACAWKAGQGILITRAIADAMHSAELWERVRDHPERRARYLQGLSRLLSSLFANQVWHNDLHLGNLLAVEHAERIEFTFVDFYEVKIVRRLSLTRKRKMLACVTAFQHDLSAAEARVVLQPLWPELPPHDLNRLWQDLCQRATRLVHRRWRRRRRALLRDSTICRTIRTPRGLWRLRRGFDLHVAEAVIHAYQRERRTEEEGEKGKREKGEKGGWIKHEAACSTVFVQVQNEVYIVKEFTPISYWKRGAPDRRSWLKTWRLELYGMTIAKYLAWLRTDQRVGYIIQEYIPGTVYARALALHAHDPSVQQHLENCLQAFLRRLLVYGAVPRDYITQELIVFDPRTPCVRFPRWYPDMVIAQSEVALIDSEAVGFVGE